MALFMDAHTITGGVSLDDVAAAHEADLATQDAHGVNYLRYWVDGVLRHRDEPGISPFDSVVQGGDAVWEGLRLYDGRIFGLAAHLARLRRSATAPRRAPTR